MAVRAVTGVFYVAIMVVCFLRPTAMLLVFSLIVAMTVWEFCSLVNARENVAVNRFICSVSGVFLMLAMFGFCSGLASAVVFIPYLITVIYIFIAELYLKQSDPLNNWAYSMMSQLYIALPLSTINIPAYYSGEFHYLLPLSIFIFLWCNDTGAYLAGSLLGRHKLFPRISPGKSWEGSAGGAVLAVAASAVIWYTATPGEESLTLPQWIGLGLVVVLSGTWGDLVESLLKRNLGIKDSGNILPGHGGMLDRFDSSLMAIPASTVYIYTISSFMT